MPRQPILDPSRLARATERLCSLVPGYSGYKSRERAREEDRTLRETVSRQLGVIVGRMERALSYSIRDLPPEDVEQAGALLRVIGRHRDRVRFAPAGYTSLFARKKIQLAEIESLVALDAGLWSGLEEMDRLAAAWDEGARRGRPEWPREAIRDAVISLEERIEERENYLRS